MAESTHSIYKSEFMKGKYSVDVDEHIKHLKEFMEYYNDKRFPFEFHGCAPTEVLEGETPVKSRFRKQIEERRKERIDENRVSNECSLVCV